MEMQSNAKSIKRCFQVSAQLANMFRNSVMWLQHAVTINCAAKPLWCVCPSWRIGLIGVNWIESIFFFVYFTGNSTWLEYSVHTRRKHETSNIPRGIRIRSTSMRSKGPATNASTLHEMPFVCHFIFYLWVEKSRFDIESLTISMHISHERIFHSAAVGCRVPCAISLFATV